MLKNILNLNGALELSKNEQKEINGGKGPSTGCSTGGTLNNINTCLCKSGVYNPTTTLCMGGTPTGNIFENATGCCYVQAN